MTRGGPAGAGVVAVVVAAAVAVEAAVVLDVDDGEAQAGKLWFVYVTYDRFTCCLTGTTGFGVPARRKGEVPKGEVASLELWGSRAGLLFCV